MKLLHIAPRRWGKTTRLLQDFKHDISMGLHPVLLTQNQATCQYCYSQAQELLSMIQSARLQQLTNQQIGVQNALMGSVPNDYKLEEALKEYLEIEWRERK